MGRFAIIRPVKLVEIDRSNARRRRRDFKSRRMDRTRIAERVQGIVRAPNRRFVKTKGRSDKSKSCKSFPTTSSEWPSPYPPRYRSS